ncbi:MAG: C10 family peptidase [Bacteroidales bacterium]|jgi:hypothetical protein|nr:C10 family peptidase [Bacteroidales bacterium]MCI1733928.1 C10 family peptidase [Bacteroidales bacterium]
MKKLRVFLLLFSAVLFFSCGKMPEPKTDPVSIVAMDSTYIVSESQSLNLCLKTLNALDPSSKSSSSNARVVSSFVKISSLISGKGTFTKAGKMEAPSFYLFNFSNNQGYALASADKRDDGAIYMFSEKGNLNLSDIDTSSIQHYVLNLIEKYHNYQIDSCNSSHINKVQTKGVADKDGYESITTSVITAKYGPLITTAWDQDDPFNYYANNYGGAQCRGKNPHMGCGPIAVAQLAAYYNYPSSYTQDGITYTFNWSIINQGKTKSDLNSDTIRKYEVSKFIYAVACAEGIKYGTDGSSVSRYFLKKGLTRLGFVHESHTHDFTYPAVRLSLTQSHPVIIRGDTTDAKRGHVWLIDGFSEITDEVRAYDEQGNLVENTVLNIYNYNLYYKYIHCNFGWGAFYSDSNRDYEYSSQYENYTANVNASVFKPNKKYTFNQDLRILSNVHN